MPTRVANLNQISTAAHRMFAGQDPKKNCEVLSAWIQRIPISTYRTPFKQFQHRYLLGSSSVYADNGDISQYTHVDLGGTKHPFRGNKFPFPRKNTSGSTVAPWFVHILSEVQVVPAYMFEVFTGTGKCQQGSGQVPKESQGAGWSINSGRMSRKVGRSK